MPPPNACVDDAAKRLVLRACTLNNLGCYYRTRGKLLLALQVCLPLAREHRACMYTCTQFRWLLQNVWLIDACPADMPTLDGGYICACIPTYTPYMATYMHVCLPFPQFHIRHTHIHTNDYTRHTRVCRTPIRPSKSNSRWTASSIQSLQYRMYTQANMVIYTTCTHAYISAEHWTGPSNRTFTGLCRASRVHTSQHVHYPIPGNDSAFPVPQAFAFHTRVSELRQKSTHVCMGTILFQRVIPCLQPPSCLLLIFPQASRQLQEEVYTCMHVCMCTVSFPLWIAYCRCTMWRSQTTLVIPCSHTHQAIKTRTCNANKRLLFANS